MLISLQLSIQNKTFLLKFVLYLCEKPLLFVLEFQIYSVSLLSDFHANYKYVSLSLLLCLHPFV